MSLVKETDSWARDKVLGTETTHPTANTQIIDAKIVRLVNCPPVFLAAKFERATIVHK